MLAKRARLYDALAAVTMIVVIALDQWTKSLVVKNIPLFSQVPLPLVGRYLVLEHIHNSGAAFSMLNSNGSSIFLVILIAIAIAVVGYLYIKMINSGTLFYKIVFGMIMGGAFGNLIDRAIHSGYVIDFISFRIPEIHFYFAIFNVADACISVGVVLLFILLLLGGGFGQSVATQENNDTPMESRQTDTPAIQSGTVRTTEQDVQSN